METLMAISVTVIAGNPGFGPYLLDPCSSPGPSDSHEAEKLIDSVRLQVAPVSRDVGLISRDVKSLVQSIHRQVGRVEDGIETVHDMAVLVKEFQFEIKRRIELPMLQLAAVIGGMKRGIEAVPAFFAADDITIWKKKKNNSLDFCKIGLDTPLPC